MKFSEKRFESENRRGEYLKYLEYKPEGHEKLLLFIYIHGAGGRGDDITKIAMTGPMGEIERGRDIKAVCVAPQCHCDTWFELFDVLLEFLDTMRNRDDVDITRVYGTGSSMGAYTLWQVLMSRPDWFAAAVPVCGGGMYWNAARLKDVPIWAFHGALDGTVLPEETVKMVAAVNRNGGSAKITVYPDRQHDAWTPTFASDEMWNWMFAQKRTENN